MDQDGSTEASREGEQRYHDAITKEQELQMCAVRTFSGFKRETIHADLSHSKLLSYLDLDERPSFAIHAGSTPHPDGPLDLIYSNPALKNADGIMDKVTGQQTTGVLFVESSASHCAFRNWLLGVVDECDLARRGTAYLFEGYLWSAVHVEHYKVVNGVLTAMVWSDPCTTKSPPRLSSHKEGHPTHLPLRAHLRSECAVIRSPDVNSPREENPMDTLSSNGSPHGPHDYTLQLSPLANVPEHVKYFRDTDWSQTPLGVMTAWPPELRCVVNMALNDCYPAVLFWGKEAIMIYNEAYIQLLGGLHPCMGKSARTYASTHWPKIASLIENVNATGTSTREHDVPLFIERHGFLEERRVSTLVELGSQTANARSFQTFWEITLQTLSTNGKDVPFALLYSTEHQYGSELSTISSPGTGSSIALGNCKLKGCIGVESGHLLAPTTINLQDSTYVFHSYLVEAAKLGKAIMVRLADLNIPDDVLASVDWKGYGDPCRIVVICPITPTTGNNAQTEGFVIIGVNPRRSFDESYKKFVHVMLRLMATSLASVVLFEAEVKQKEKAIENAANLQRQLLNEIGAKEKKFQSFAERSDVAIFIMDAVGTYTYRNRRW